jgi:hypothetical protein
VEVQHLFNLLLLFIAVDALPAYLSKVLSIQAA